MEILLDFWVPGTPVPQGSKIAVPRRRRDGGLSVWVAEDRSRRKRLAAWRGAISDVARIMWGERPQITGPVVFGAEFYLARPRSHYGRDGAIKKSAPAHHIVRPDIDKLVRGALDSITESGVWRDDSLVRSLESGKFYSGDRGQAGVRIKIWREA